MATARNLAPRSKRQRLSWDLGIGIVLLACGLALALWERPQKAPPGGNAALRAPGSLPYP